MNIKIEDKFSKCLVNETELFFEYLNALTFGHSSHSLKTPHYLNSFVLTK